MGLICFHSAALTARVSGFSAAAQGDRVYACMRADVYVHMHVTGDGPGWASQPTDCGQSALATVMVYR